MTRLKDQYCCQKVTSATEKACIGRLRQKIRRTDDACPAAHLEADGDDALAEFWGDPRRNSKSASRFPSACIYSAAARSVRMTCRRLNSLGVMPVWALNARLKGPSD